MYITLLYKQVSGNIIAKDGASRAYEPKDWEESYEISSLGHDLAVGYLNSEIWVFVQEEAS